MFKVENFRKFSLMDISHLGEIKCDWVVDDVLLRDTAIVIHVLININVPLKTTTKIMLTYLSCVFLGSGCNDSWLI